MKRIITIVLALIMVFSLVACNRDNNEETQVEVFWYDESDVYLSSVRSELDKKFEDLGIKHHNQFATNDQAKQLDQIRTAVAGGANFLVVNLVTSGATDTAKDILKIAGDIPVVFFNRAIGVDGSELPLLKEYKNAAFIGTDAPEAGHIQGKMIGEYVAANFDKLDLNKDGKISYAMFKGDESNIEAIYRTQFGVEDANKVLIEKGKPELVYFDANNKDKYQVDQNGAWSAEAAKNYMDTNFVTFNEQNKNAIELVICNNDGMAEGVIASLQANGYNKKDAHIVPVFGVDATANAQQLISDGFMTGTVKQDAEGMAKAIAESVSAISSGKTTVEALAGLKDERFSLDKECNTKLYIAYAPYTGK